MGSDSRAYTVYCIIMLYVSTLQSSRQADIVSFIVIYI